MGLSAVTEALFVLDGIELKGEDYYPRDFRPELSWEQFDVLWKALDDARHALAEDIQAGAGKPQALPLPVSRVAHATKEVPVERAQIAFKRIVNPILHSPREVPEENRFNGSKARSRVTVEDLQNIARAAFAAPRKEKPGHEQHRGFMHHLLRRLLPVRLRSPSEDPSDHQ